MMSNSLQQRIAFWSRWWTVVSYDTIATFMLMMVLLTFPPVIMANMHNVSSVVVGLMVMAIVLVPLCIVIFVQALVVDQRIRHARWWALIGMSGAILDVLLGLGWLSGGYGFVLGVTGVAFGVATTGVLLGGVTVLLLRQAMVASQLWTLCVGGLIMGAAALGGTLGGSVAVALQGVLAEVLVAMVIGGLIGAIQLPLLRAQGRVAGLWIAASAAAWCLGALVKEVMGLALSLPFAIVIGRFALVLVTGVALNRVLRVGKGRRGELGLL